jgi:hypothetical protein
LGSKPEHDNVDQKEGIMEDNTLADLSAEETDTEFWILVMGQRA